MYAAGKYIVAPLVNRCSRFLEDNIDETDVCMILQQSILYDKRDLTKRCLMFIKKNANDILKADGFQGIDEQTLMLIINQDELNVSEVELFRGCVKWAEANTVPGEETAGQMKGTVLRTALGNILHHIRFPTMSVEEFNEVVIPLDILKTEEILELYKYITNNKVKPKTRFPVKKRKLETSILRFASQHINLDISNAGRQFTVEIVINATIKLEALYFIGHEISSQANPTISGLVFNGLHCSPIKSESGAATSASTSRLSEGRFPMTYAGPLEEHSTIEHDQKTYRVYRLLLSDSANPCIIHAPGSMVSWDFIPGLDCDESAFCYTSIVTAVSSGAPYTSGDVTITIPRMGSGTPLQAIEFIA